MTLEIEELTEHGFHGPYVAAAPAKANPSEMVHLSFEV
jgi:hypothetical protein